MNSIEKIGLVVFLLSLNLIVGDIISNYNIITESGRLPIQLLMVFGLIGFLLGDKMVKMISEEV